MSAQKHIRRLSAADLDSHRTKFTDLYREVYAEAPYCETEEHVIAYVERFADESSRPGFSLIVAEIDAELAGYAYGHSFGPDEWWPDTDDELIKVKGKTKFVICELIVRKPHRGTGIGTALMKTLLHGRRENLVTLCANPAAPARAIYQRWGWRSVARAHFPNTPPMDVLLLPLRQRPHS